MNNEDITKPIGPEDVVQRETDEIAEIDEEEIDVVDEEEAAETEQIKAELKERERKLES